MSSYYPFDSRNPLYRSKTGAAAAGENLALRLLLHRDAHCHEAFLQIRRDDETAPREIALTKGETLNDYVYYETEFSLETGLYWYSFRYTSDFGTFCITKDPNHPSRGIVSDGSGAWWQQTVYDADFTVPDWLTGGVIYQIFPDRFYASGKEKKNVPKDRFLVSTWSKQPEYRQEGGPCTLSNDYYGGDLAGITEKLPYIASLGVTCLYLNPIFEAHSNHRYNTADYRVIDPLLGDEEDLRELCQKAEELGISIILDGVFSHTGDDSRYFNRLGRYPEKGAYQDKNSPYYPWFSFSEYPDRYAAWWGIADLPETQENNPEFTEFITGENGVLRYWLKAGIRGWRLDVADELPDAFLDHIRSAIKTEREDAFLLGEVWEDASNKISYGARRRFLLGKQLDSVMNYPFANAIIDYVCGGAAENLANTTLSILENYPLDVVHVLMNHVGTHDTARVLTQLAHYGKEYGDRAWQSRQVLSKSEYDEGIRRLRLAAAIQYTLPGVPSLFYGDEAGVQGFGDPFCRATFPWGQEDQELTKFYKALGQLRKDCSAFKKGDFLVHRAERGFLLYERRDQNGSVFIAVNRTENEAQFALPSGFKIGKSFFGNKPKNGVLSVCGKDFAVFTAKEESR